MLEPDDTGGLSAEAVEFLYLPQAHLGRLAQPIFLDVFFSNFINRLLLLTVVTHLDAYPTSSPWLPEGSVLSFPCMHAKFTATVRFRSILLGDVKGDILISICFVLEQWRRVWGQPQLAVGSVCRGLPAKQQLKNDLGTLFATPLWECMFFSPGPLAGERS